MIELGCMSWGSFRHNWPHRNVGLSPTCSGLRRRADALSSWHCSHRRTFGALECSNLQCQSKALNEGNCRQRNARASPTRKAALRRRPIILYASHCSPVTDLDDRIQAMERFGCVWNIAYVAMLHAMRLQAYSASALTVEIARSIAMTRNDYTYDYDNNHSYNYDFPYLWIWLYMAMATAMTTAMAIALATPRATYSHDCAKPLLCLGQCLCLVTCLTVSAHSYVYDYRYEYDKGCDYRKP